MARTETDIRPRQTSRTVTRRHAGRYPNFDHAFDVVTKAIRQERAPSYPPDRRPLTGHESIAMYTQLVDALVDGERKLLSRLDDHHTQECDVAREAGYIIGVQVGLRLRGVR